LKQSFLEVNGLNIRYLESGGNVIIDDSTIRKEQSPCNDHLLFIHGLGSSADRWLDIPDALSLLGFHVVALDLPGFGLSEKPENMDYTIRQFVQIVARAADKAGIIGSNKKLSIVGHSLGGYIGAQLAIDYPNLVNKLVLMDTSGMLDGPTPLLQQYLEAALNPSKQAVRAVFEQLVADPMRIPDALVDAFIYRIIKLQGSTHAFKSAFYNSVYTNIGVENLKQIGNNNIPVLIIWGKQDRLIPLQHLKIFQEAIKGSRVVIVEDAGHAPFAEKPAIACELLHRFFSST
jgi:2-hydroxy-6-oxonona-2,4-dienedioate hydrolase